MEEKEKYNRLTIISEEIRGDHYLRYCICKCDCGNTTECRKYHIVKGIIKSCGCLRNEIAAKRMTTHGMSRTKTFCAWSNMIQRCTNDKHPEYYNYGGRGIIVSNELRSFEGFFKHLGECPDGYELDRINTNGNYEPGNVRWATESTQNHNQRKRKGMSSQFIGVHWCKYQQAAKELYND